MPSLGIFAPVHPLDLAGEIGMRAAITLEHRLPLVAQTAAAFAEARAEALVDAVGHEKMCVFGPAAGSFRKPHFVFAQRLAVRRAGVLLVRRAVRDVALDDDERGTIPGRAE